MTNWLFNLTNSLLVTNDSCFPLVEIDLKKIHRSGMMIPQNFTLKQVKGHSMVEHNSNIQHPQTYSHPQIDGKVVITIELVGIYFSIYLGMTVAKFH